MTESDLIYFADKSLSKSAIDLLLECPALYKAWLEDAADEKQSEAMNFGTMAHLLTLQPENFSKQYAVTDLNLATKEGKAFKNSLPEGVTICKTPDYEKAQLMADAVRDHPQAKMLFQDYETEKPIFWEYQGIRCKAKPDILAKVDGQYICADLKTSDSANPAVIQKSIFKYGYHRQAAWYLSGLEAIGKHCLAFIFIFVDKKSPYITTLCQLDDAALKKGVAECDEAVEKLKECLATGLYPCYTRDIMTISLPSWAA